jgi:hypothetical protein
VRRHRHGGGGDLKSLQKKYRRFTGEHATELQGKALIRRGKAAGAKTGGNRRKKAETIQKQGTALLAATKKPAYEQRAGDRSDKSETRISTIADFGHLGKQEKKALLLFLRAAVLAIAREPPGNICAAATGWRKF